MGKQAKAKQRRKTASKEVRTANQLPSDALRKSIKMRLSVIEQNVMWVMATIRNLVQQGGLLSRQEIMIELLGKKMLGVPLEEEEELALREAVLGPEEPTQEQPSETTVDAAPQEATASAE